MKVAAIQYKPPKGRPEEARRALVGMVEEAAAAGARLVVCPEMAITGYIWKSPAEIGPLTEPAHGPTLEALAPVARRHRCWVVCGFAERFVHIGRRSPEGRRTATLYNSALLINPEGSLATCYRKVLLYSADERWAAPGHRRPICPTAFGDMVPGICMDLNDDGFTAFLAEHRPALVPFCTNWTEEGEDVLRYWRWRLRGLGCCFVAANTWGEDEGVGFSGESAILGPELELLARGPKRGDAVIYAELPLEERGGTDVR